MKKAVRALIALMVVAMGWSALAITANADGPVTLGRSTSGATSYTSDLSLVAPVTITQNTDPETIDSPSTIACGNQTGGYTTQNSYWRTFDLDGEFGLTETLSIESFTFGVENATSAFNLSINAYTLDGPLNTANLTLIGSGAATVDELNVGQLVTVPLTATVAPTETLVMEINIPSGESLPASLYIGSNGAGQSGPSYLSAPDCGATQPADLATLGFPNVHIIMVVAGETGAAPTAVTLGDLSMVAASNTLPVAAFAVAGLALAGVVVVLFRRK